MKPLGIQQQKLTIMKIDNFIDKSLPQFKIEMMDDWRGRLLTNISNLCIGTTNPIVFLHFFYIVLHKRQY